jgi:hypothetical protein
VLFVDRAAGMDLVMQLSRAHAASAGDDRTTSSDEEMIDRLAG